MGQRPIDEPQSTPSRWMHSCRVRTSWVWKIDERTQLRRSEGRRDLKDDSLGVEVDKGELALLGVGDLLCESLGRNLLEEVEPAGAG